MNEVILNDIALAVRRINAGAEYPSGIIPMSVLNELEQALGLPLTVEKRVMDLKEGDIILIRGHAERVMQDVTEARFESSSVSGPGGYLVTLGLYWYEGLGRRLAMPPHHSIVPNGTKYTLARPGDWGFDTRLGISKNYSEENNLASLGNRHSLD